MFAGYTIERRLGGGGMGVVYLAHHPRLPLHIALKVLNDSLAGNSDARKAFETEAELAAGLDHPNIVAIYDRSEPGDPVLWIAGRFIAGGDVAALLEAEPGGVDPDRAVRLIVGAAHALDFAHNRNVLHRDVKPANLLLANDPVHGEHVLLTDFGIARALDGTLTNSSVAASPPYVAPERFDPEQQTGPRADQYSLGCTFYHLLTGQYPYPSEDWMAMALAHRVQPVPDPRALRPDLPVALTTVVATVLAKDPADRYPSCIDFAYAAAQALHHPGPADRSAGRADFAGGTFQGMHPEPVAGPRPEHLPPTSSAWPSAGVVATLIAAVVIGIVTIVLITVLVPGGEAADDTPSASAAGTTETPVEPSKPPAEILKAGVGDCVFGSGPHDEEWILAKCTLATFTVLERVAGGTDIGDCSSPEAELDWAHPIPGSDVLLCLRLQYLGAYDVVGHAEVGSCLTVVGSGENTSIQSSSCDNSRVLKVTSRIERYGVAETYCQAEETSTSWKSNAFPDIAFTVCLGPP
ncbi:serine/threonine-protein kinase [Nocardia sp. NPDC051750]|uniref:serine/threonine-protein kinase n=1 Tax=Nocardia sp. NPDC051750 TaxID=3364325 RepID=UPI0037920984